jgi:hypothetical protein
MTYSKDGSFEKLLRFFKFANDIYINDHGIHLMQYVTTHGKQDIYEGDILQCGNPNGLGVNFPKFLAEVVYDEVFTGFYLKPINYKTHTYVTVGSYFYDYNAHVVGNIYEHPNLLKNKIENKNV